MNVPTPIRHVCILGATSAMAVQTARLLAKQGHRLMLVARSRERLEALSTDLTARGASDVRVIAQDLETLPNPGEFLAGVRSGLGGLDSVLIFHGYLGSNGEARANPNVLESMVAINFTSAASLSLAAGELLETSAHPRPVLLAIGSVAGDRGRASNYVYGATKAALATLLQGMSHESAIRRGKLRVVLVKAGLTVTPMTDGLVREGPLWSSVESVADVILKAMDGNRSIVYAPWFWRPIMLVIRCLPERVMNRLSL